MSEDDLPAPLRADAADHGASFMRALAGATPVVGAFLAEVVTQLIPNQRMERLAKYTRRLAGRLTQVEGRVRKIEELGPTQIALFEEGAYASARATSDERIEQIARIVSDGMTGEQQTAENQRRVLAVLNDLFDTDVLLLAALAGVPVDLTRAPTRTLGWFNNASPTEQEEHRELEALEEHRLQRLISLGLVAQKTELKMTRPFNGAARPYMQPERPELSRLGRLVVRRVGYEPRR